MTLHTNFKKDFKMSYVANKNIVENMPIINEHRKKFFSLSKELEKTVLTGKISSLEGAETLFDFMEKTQVDFFAIQDELIKNLVEENLKKLLSSVASRAQVIVDILVRNLFERAADVGFLATDDDIIRFLKEPFDAHKSKDFIKTRLHKYILKYSVYDDIIVLNMKGEVVINFDDSNKIKNSKDPILQETLFGNTEFCELLRHSDLQAKKDKSLIYTAKISSENESLGVLCLCFNMEQEMCLIFERLKIFNMYFALLDAKGTILSSNQKTNSTSVLIKSYSKNVLYDSKMLSCIAKSNGYQGYNGQDWFGFASSDYKTSFKSFDVNFSITAEELEETEIISKRIKKIKTKLEDVIHDLSDVVINGEIIASKRKPYSLNPVLDNIRKMSENINGNIKQYIQNIYITTSQSYINTLSFNASLCLDIMDRNLYE